MRTCKELGPIDADARIGEPLSAVLHHAVAFKPEVALRMVRGILHQHDPRERRAVNLGIEAQRAEIKIGPGITIDEEKSTGPQKWQRVKDAATGLERLRALIRVGNAYAVAFAIAER